MFCSHSFPLSIEIEYHRYCSQTNGVASIIVKRLISKYTTLQQKCHWTRETTRAERCTRGWSNLWLIRGNHSHLSQNTNKNNLSPGVSSKLCGWNEQTWDKFILPESNVNSTFQSNRIALSFERCMLMAANIRERERGKKIPTRS